jgi:phosphoenolpyruvate synthase/pyruvate phosphate dikinase
MKIQTGSRAHTLAAMIAAKLPIPAGFVIAAEAFEAFVEHNAIDTIVSEALHGKSFDSAKELKSISTQIKKRILSGEFPHDIAKQILSMYVKLGEPRVILFPSITLAEKDFDSFTPGDTTFFGYSGDANLFEGIKELWSHFFNPAPLYYRLKHKKAHFDLPFAITVQTFPPAKVSGVLFTDDPTSHTKQTVLVKVVFGEGALVGNFDGADYYWIKRGTGEVYKSSADTQKTKIHFAHGDEEVERLSSVQSKKRKATPLLLEQLGKLANKLQQHAFFPQHATFSFDGRTLSLIDTKAAPAHAHTPRPAAPVPLKASAAARAKQTNSVTLGLLHPLTQASHLPTVTHLSGHLYIQPQYLLSQYEENLSEQKKRLLIHEVARTVAFVAQHCKADHGFIYAFPKVPNSASHVEAQLQALQDVRQNFPLLPLLLVADTTGTQPYRLWVATWNTHGFVRSSHIRHATLITTPAGVHALDESSSVGLDAVVVDVDSLDHFIHGGGVSDKEIQSTDALVQALQRICTWCDHNGIQAIFSSKRPVDYAMLEQLAADLSIEWITTDRTYSLLKLALM